MKIGTHFHRFLPLVTPDVLRSLEKAEAEWQNELVCPSEFSFGCIVPFGVDVGEDEKTRAPRRGQRKRKQRRRHAKP